MQSQRWNTYKWLKRGPVQIELLMSLMILEETEAKELSLRFSPLKLNRNVSRWMEKNTIFFLFLLVLERDSLLIFRPLFKKGRECGGRPTLSVQKWCNWHVSAEFSRWILWALRGPIKFGPKLKSTEEHVACWAGFRGEITKENEDFKQISKKAFFIQPPT